MANMSNGQGPPAHLMSMLATLMLNKRLQQGRVRNSLPTPPGNAYGLHRLENGRPGNPNQQNRMAQLAQMQLEMGRRPRMPMPPMM